MGKTREGIISFEDYQVEKVSFQKNDQYQGEDVELDLGIEAEVFLNEEGFMMVKLILNIFQEAEEKKYPFEMEVVVLGRFSSNFDDTVDEEELLNYQGNALAILFPYVRALVSTYTAISNVTPLTLPTININRVLHDNKGKEELEI